MRRLVKKLGLASWMFILLLIMFLAYVIDASELRTLRWGDKMVHLRCFDGNVTFDTTKGQAEWKKNNSSVIHMFKGMKRYEPGITQERYGMLEDYTLVFHSVDYQHQASYECRYSSLQPGFPFQQNEFDVKVEERPIYIDGCSDVSCEQPITGVVTRNITCSKAGAKVRPTIRCNGTNGIRVVANDSNTITQNADGSYTTSVTYQLQVEDRTSSSFTCWLINVNGETTSMTFIPTSTPHTGTDRTIGLSVGLTLGLGMIFAVVVVAIVYHTKLRRHRRGNKSPIRDNIGLNSTDNDVSPV